MSLDLSKLDKVIELPDGVKRARCPACAESGSDKTGQHLRIYPDGKFGCCVHPRESEHRSRIYALAGDRAKRGIKVRVSVGAGQPLIRRGILATVSETFGTIRTPDATDGTCKVEDENCDTQEHRTLRTDETESESDLQCKPVSRTPRTGLFESNEQLCTSERTLRTPLDPLVLQQNRSEIENDRSHIYKGFNEGVRCVRNAKAALPYLTASGDLVIPFDSPPRYHWWKAGQSVKETLAELSERAKEIENGVTF
jgi:hypothetical protein